MFTDFGIPPNAANFRSIVETRLKEQRDTTGVAETLTVEWRGASLHVEVIDVPLNALFYNPGTHRIRAQRSLIPKLDGELTADPWSSESQDYLKHLLTIRPSEPGNRDPAFDELKESLAEHKQIEPGLITRDGILVNGNTRCAALRELNSTTHMRVAVLPASCTWGDINDVELSLQLRPDTRRDYSYINRLLAIDEQRGQLNRDLAAIAKSFHTTVPACERDQWVLAQLRDLIERSVTDEGASLRLMDFEGAQEKLAELYRAYDKEQGKSKERADLMKEARLSAITLDFSKTDVRNINADFLSNYLESTLPQQYREDEGAAAPSSVSIPGLNRNVKAAGPNVSAARAITNKLLKAKAVEAAGDAATPAQSSAASTIVDSYKKAFETAIDSADRDERLRKKRRAAPDRVSDACKHLEQSITDVVMSRGNSSLDEGAFDDSLEQLRGVLAKLAVEAQRSIDLPGNGLAWLIGAVEPKQAQQ
ncbi:transcriptional regulator [Rhodococcus qingshengii]|uniref:transcriptional regulator n=1 Tax=Rhodococcus qingshengii TaxID=334542 RepID=UPI001AE7EBF6|nr:transcriptional regulator [Rhodococcus qingshengii]MBP1054053.1 transcriptional regulator [Rhodococcus qingshengii]WCT00153.1 transcriptional regulator [Rhodococcus qingshengii]